MISPPPNIMQKSCCNHVVQILALTVVCVAAFRLCRTHDHAHGVTLCDKPGTELGGSIVDYVYDRSRFGERDHLGCALHVEHREIFQRIDFLVANSASHYHFFQTMNGAYILRIKYEIAQRIKEAPAFVDFNAL